MSPADLLRYVDVPARTQNGAAGRGTLVLLHAFPLNAHMWEPQLALADDGWRIIAPHLRGFGGSGEPQPQISMDDYADDVVGLLGALHVENAVVVGLSMGGYAAFALMRRAPQAVRALVLADTRPESDTTQAREGRRALLAVLAEGGPAAVADRMLPNLLSERTRQHRPAVAARVRSLVLENSSAAIAGAIHALMTREDATGLLDTIGVPTLIVTGSEDSVTPTSVGEEMHQRIAGSSFVTIPDAGHLSSLEQPSAFNAALVGFLNHRL